MEKNNELETFLDHDKLKKLLNSKNILIAYQKGQYLTMFYISTRLF